MGRPTERHQSPYEKLWQPGGSGMTLFHVLKELSTYSFISSKR